MKLAVFVDGGSFELSRHLGEASPASVWSHIGKTEVGARDRRRDGGRPLGQIRPLQSQGPDFMGGFSSGGPVAYEMARQLRQTDKR